MMPAAHSIHCACFAIRCPCALRRWRGRVGVSVASSAEGLFLRYLDRNLAGNRKGNRRGADIAFRPPEPRHAIDREQPFQGSGVTDPDTIEKITGATLPQNISRSLDEWQAAFERIVALEAYVKDLKWAIDKLGYDPAKHGYPPDKPKESHHE